MFIDRDIDSMYNYTWGGFKPGELVLISTPNGTGKSIFWDIESTDGIWKDTKVKEPKYKFSRAKWYTVQLNGHATWRFSDEYNQIIDWCTQHFGPHPSKPDAWSRWYVGLGYIKIRDAKDYEWYILRWS